MGQKWDGDVRMADLAKPPTPTPTRSTSDDPDELFDLVDRDDHVIGQVRRGDAHRDPSRIHRSVQILVFPSDDRLLLQRRSPSKDLFPGYYCASASGHVASGEMYETTAQREIHEELGITLQLTYAGKTLVCSQPETEMTAIFLARSDGPYHFHPTETTGGALFTWEEVQRRRRDGSLQITPALAVALDELQRLQRRGALAARFQSVVPPTG